MKKISHKDIAKMSTGEFLKASSAPYRRLLSYMRPYYGRFFLGAFFSVLFGFSNALLLISMRYVFSWVLPGSTPIKLPKFLTNLGVDIDTSAFTQADGQVGIGAVVIACLIPPAIMALRGVFSYLSSYCMMWVGIKVLGDIRTELFGKMLNHSLAFFNKTKAGELIQTVFNQTRMAQTALTSILGDLLKGPISIIGILGMLLYIDWKFTVAATVVFPLCILPILVISRRVRKAGSREEEEAGLVMVIMQEAFAGIRVVKSHAREDYERDRFNDANEKMLRFLMRWRKALEIVGPLVESVASLGIAVALFYAWKTQISAGDFLVLVGSLIVLYPHAKALSRIPVFMQKALAAISKVFDLMDRKIDIEDKPDAIPLVDCRGEIEFKDVSFHYNKENRKAVRDVSFHIKPGKTYALVGPSGAGKSTMFSLLLRFYDPKKGSICFDGHDLRDLQQTSLRDQIGIVNQDTFLFHDTIYNNILYGFPDATREQVLAASKKAHAHEFILEQDNGYDTVVGDKGCMLSGGQQQRISIARAILRDAPILLLDEATSALDTESEKNIQEALEVLSSGKTVIAIAHRLSTILNADNIVVMNEGTIADIGTHAELLTRCPLYQNLYNLQFGHTPAETPEPATP